MAGSDGLWCCSNIYGETRKPMTRDPISYGFDLT
jgi:hypothetical protein